jgi:MFS family permease
VAPKELAIPFFIASGFVVGFGVILFNVTAISLIQAITPDRMLGRANASRRFVVWGVIPIGGLVGGALASTIGLRETIFVGAIGSLFAVIPILVSPVRSVGRMSELDDSLLLGDRLGEQRPGVVLPG